MPSSTVAFRAKTVIVLTMLCAPLSLADVPVQADPPTEQIKALLRVNGSEDLVANIGHLMGQAVLAELHRTYPTISRHAEAAISSAVEDYVYEHSSRGEVTDLLVPIYAKYLTKRDIEALIAFYKSPIGKKVAAVTPAITADSTVAGQQWAASLAAGLQQRLRDVLRNEKLGP